MTMILAQSDFFLYIYSVQNSIVSRDEIHHIPRLSARSEAEVKQKSHHVKFASKWRRIGAHLCCDYTGMGPGNMHSLTNMAITVCVFMCIGGVLSEASFI